MTKICRWRSSRWISVPQTPYTPRNQIRKNPNQFIHSSIHVWILLLFLSPSFPLITIFPPSSVQTPSSPTLSLLTLSSFLKCKKLYIGEKIGFIYFEIIVSILIWPNFNLYPCKYWPKFTFTSGMTNASFAPGIRFLRGII